MLNVLLVEDDLDLAETVIQYLELENIRCIHAASGVAGLQLAHEGGYQVLILDLNLPRLDGLHLCEKLRAEGDETPVLMLTARDSLDDKLAGFAAGTDDYLVKPFALQELVVRLRALSGRRSGQAQILHCEDLEMNLADRRVTRGEVEIKLSPTGWKLLEILLRASPKVVSRKTLEEQLWPDDLPDSNSLKVHIHKLRKRLDDPFPHPLLQTIPGHGFALRLRDKDST